VLVRASGIGGTASLRASADAEEFMTFGHDVVIECAGQQALRDYGAAVLAHGVDLVPASVGALVDDGLRAALCTAAETGGGILRLPSGAIVGIDGLAAARHAGIDDVLYRGTMPPHALKSAGAVEMRARTVVFEGTAREAVAKYPKNANLTGTIALTGAGFDRTRVELIVDPAVERNVHELRVSGAFGEFEVRVSGYRIAESSPSSRLVAGSLVQAATGSNFTKLF
jgi:aspartate dehydrogenase